MGGAPRRHVNTLPCLLGFHGSYGGNEIENEVIIIGVGYFLRALYTKPVCNLDVLCMLALPGIQKLDHEAIRFTYDPP